MLLTEVLLVCVCVCVRVRVHVCVCQKGQAVVVVRCAAACAYCVSHDVALGHPSASWEFWLAILRRVDTTQDEL